MQTSAYTSSTRLPLFLAHLAGQQSTRLLSVLLWNIAVSHGSEPPPPALTGSNAKPSTSLATAHAWLPSLQHRRTVAGLTFLYKLHCLPNNSPLKTLLPAQPTIRPAVLHPTRLSSAIAKSHPFTLSDGLPIRSRRSVRNAFPACVISVWNSLPQFLLSRPPQPQHMQQFKTNVHRYLLKSNWNTATDAL